MAQPNWHPEQGKWDHAPVSRRVAIQAGSVGLLGLGINHLDGLQALSGDDVKEKQKSVIYIFLSGGLGQHDSFDMKPGTSEEIRGEFKPISTATTGLQICEHLPKLASISNHWSLVRSLTHPYNEHSIGHHVMLTGRTPEPVGFQPNRPTSSDFPSIPAIVGRLFPRKNNLPPAAVLPEQLIHVSGRKIPGQYAGSMGEKFDPWFVEASHFRDTSYIHGAFPEYGFQRWEGKKNPKNYRFEAPRFELTPGMLRDQFESRSRLMKSLEAQRRELDAAASIQQFDRIREESLSLLTRSKVQQALDVHSAPAKIQERYGKNSFGWSLLMARQLVEAGVRLVQVNLGNDESWDTHEKAFSNLKNFLFPPTDRAVSALIEDLHERGLLDDTLVVMAGEFGRTPKVFTFKGAKSNLPGRDHWGALQSVFFAGGGVKGGRVVGSSDGLGAYPKDDPQKPENFAATIYQSLGLPQTIAWKDELDRPHYVYHGQPIRGLT